jgi:pimeloyl-ACP methyl ester carboxylesterase
MRGSSSLVREADPEVGHTLEACSDVQEMKPSFHRRHAGAEKIAVAEHRLVSVEELRAVAAVGERLRDTADVDPDEDVLFALAADDGAALIAVEMTERAAFGGVYLEDGILAELHPEEDARGRALANGLGSALGAPADCLHIASNRRRLRDELGRSREIDRARQDEIRDVELVERVGEIEVALRNGMEVRMRMPLDDLDDGAGADVARAERERGARVGDAMSGGDDDARSDERRAARDLAGVEALHRSTGDEVAAPGPSQIARAADQVILRARGVVARLAGARRGTSGGAEHAHDDGGDQAERDAPKTHSPDAAARMPSILTTKSLRNFDLCAHVGTSHTPLMDGPGSGRHGSPAPAALLLFFALLPSCREAKADPPPPPPPPPALALAPAPALALALAPAPAFAPAHVDRLPIPRDVPASIVHSLSGAPPTTVFLPGLCSNANAYLQAFPEAARRQGGVVAIEGDQPCGTLKDFRSFSWDAAKLHARIEAATTAAGLTAIPTEGLTLVGYSQGAALAEQLVQRWPSRYARIVLIGAPTDPSATKLAEARGIVTMSCARDVPAKMKEATKRFVRAGIPSTYLEMPDCRHGNITEGDKTFDAAFSFLRESSRP